MTTYVCTFKITTYGTSGTELPPPPSGGYAHSVLSGGGDSEKAFKERMQIEGMAIRTLLQERFDARPSNYSKADSCDWSISETGSVTELVRKIINSPARS